MKNTIIKAKYLLILSIIIFSLNGCTKDITDINEDPLAVTTVPPYLLFPEVIVNMSSQRVIEFAGSNMHAQQWQVVVVPGEAEVDIHLVYPQ
ncbi:hypothetical protein [Algibacter lectus]|uniref:hypothetical protein n=1 Tax=Algibacter lectus TaxID=221126 RepID=UPI0012699360|nr:hypothetical protein [Algibacter lectus]